ncbi:transposase family protein, partial [Tissierella creatinini]
WQSMSLDFVFGLPPDSQGNTGVVVFVDRFSKMVHLAAVPAEVTAKQTARLFVDMVFKHHGMPIDIVSDRDPRFTAHLWQEVFTLLGSQLSFDVDCGPSADGRADRAREPRARRRA